MKELRNFNLFNLFNPLNFIPRNHSLVGLNSAVHRYRLSEHSQPQYFCHCKQKGAQLQNIFSFALSINLFLNRKKFELWKIMKM